VGWRWEEEDVDVNVPLALKQVNHADVMGAMLA
jgi:hypothetical protein